MRLWEAVLKFVRAAAHCLISADALWGEFCLAILKQPGAQLNLAFLALCFATGPRLYASALIHGWLDGAERAEQVITDKWLDQPHRGHWTRWIEIHDLQERSCGRIYMEKDDWEAMNQGDRIEVVYLPDDPQPYHPGGVVFGRGHVVFDLGLLVVELGVIGYALFRIIRAQLPAPTPEENAGGG